MKAAVTTLALAVFFSVVQFYTSLAALSPTPPVGFTFASRPVAAILVALLVAAALWCAVRLARDRAPFARPSVVVLAAWIGSALLSSLLGFDPPSGLQVVGMMLLGAAFHLAYVRYASEPGVAPRTLGVYLVVGTVALGAAVAMVVVHRPQELYALNNGRAAGVFVTANQCAAFAIAFGFVALGAACVARGPLRALAIAGIATATVTLAATVSQAGIIGAAAGAVFFTFAAGARRSAMALAVACAVLATLALSRPVAEHDPSSTFDRLRTWRAGLRVAELFPLWGVGPMAYWRVYPAVRAPNGDLPGTFGALHPHDVYLSLAGETGIVGLGAFAFGWIAIVRSMRASLRLQRPPERLLALGVGAALVAVLVQGIFDTIGVVQLTFVWIPYTAVALAAARIPYGGLRPA